jgi:hypothetical protein
MSHQAGHRIEILCISAVKTVHEQRQLAKRIKHEKMNMPIHKCICDNVDLITLRVQIEKGKIKFPVRCGPEDRMAIVSPCIDVVIQLGSDYPRSSWHKAPISKKSSLSVKSIHLKSIRLSLNNSTMVVTLKMRGLFLLYRGK